MQPPEAGSVARASALPYSSQGRNIGISCSTELKVSHKYVQLLDDF